MSEQRIRPNTTLRIVRPGQEPSPDSGWLEYSVEERLAAVWELTKLCFAWSQKGNGEPRLHRSISRVLRTSR